MAITGLDHVLVGVADLEAARDSWARLGFTVTPRGRHIGWGTANYCIMLENDYVELLGIVDPAQFVNRLDEFLENTGEGLLGLAFAADEAEAVHAGLTARGIAAEPPKQLKRLLELPSGDVTPEFALVHVDREDAAGLRAFVCTHLTRDMVWQPAWMRHANGAEAIDAVRISAADPAAVAERLCRLLGTEAERTGNLLRLSCAPGGCVLEIGPGPSATPVLAGMILRVPDLDIPAGHLARSGIFFTRDTFTVSVEADDATGVDLVFALGDA